MASGKPTETILTTISSQLVADPIGAGVLPDDGVKVRFAGVFVPDNGGFALVGDANSGNIPVFGTSFLERALDHVLCPGPDLHGVMFHPASLGIDLLMFHLVDADDAAAMIE